jgi:hypothetical protein
MCYIISDLCLPSNGRPAPNLDWVSLSNKSHWEHYVSFLGSIAFWSHVIVRALLQHSSLLL